MGDQRTTFVEVRHLNRKFGERVVLDDVNFSIAAGEVIALVGASGSGKSTILRILAGLDRAAEGHVEVPRRRAVVFQDHRLMPWKRVWRNVVLGLPNGNRSLALQALREVGLEERANAWPVTLSGGEAQRVSLARALVRHPDLLLLDEPFGALDALTRLKAQALFAELCVRYRPAALLVTHDVEEALLLSDRVIVLDGGVITRSVEVDLPRPRDRADTTFVALRESLLRSLGVDTGDPHRATDEPRPIPATARSHA